MPNRMLHELHWRRRGGRYHYVDEPANLLYPSERRESSQNLQRRSADVAPDALLVWASTEVANRASIMVHDTRGDAVRAWFAGLRTGPRGRWRLHRARQISKAELEQLLIPGDTVSFRFDPAPTSAE